MIGEMTMKIYSIKLRRYKKGNAGTTRYRFGIGSFAKPFAIGYQCALHDIGISDLHVSVVNQDGEVLLDSPEIMQCLERMVIR